jgi:hypothetical protein
MLRKDIKKAKKRTGQDLSDINNLYRVPWMQNLPAFRAGRVLQYSYLIDFPI